MEKLGAPFVNGRPHRWKAGDARLRCGGCVDRLTCMTAERTEDQLLSMQDFLVWEETHPERHEYVGGVVYAMAGGSQAHAEIAMNIGGLLHGQLRGKPGCPIMSDVGAVVMCGGRHGPCQE